MEKIKEEKFEKVVVEGWEADDFWKIGLLLFMVVSNIYFFFTFQGSPIKFLLAMISAMGSFGLILEHLSTIEIRRNVFWRKIK